MRAANEDDARQAVTLLTDALHTVSLPFADRGRLIAIRRLDLGRIPARASATALALHIERIAHEMMSTAVAYDLPGAAGSDAVLFPARGHAIVSLARRYARGAPLDEWFWRTVVPRWRPALSPGDAWRLLLDAAHDSPDSALLAAEIVHEAIDGDAGSSLLASMGPGQGAEWLRAEGWSETGEPRVPGSRSVRVPHADLISRWQRRLGASDDRVVWLAMMLVLREQAGLVADPGLPARVRATLREPARTVPRVAGEEGVHTFAPALEPEPAGVSPRSRVATDEDTLPPPVPGRAVASRAHELESCGDFTPYAGLLFLVPMLERLGLAAYIASSRTLAESGFGIRLVEQIGRRAGMPPDDAMAAALAAGEEGPERIDDGDGPELPARVRDLLSRPRPRAALGSATDAWLVAVRRWSRRHPRLGLVSLIRRPGWVLRSGTHVDVCFDITRIDLRLRRLALDVDPGWVPWLGRVVRFHYLTADERAR